ncbi:MAG: nitrilase [Rhodobacteraceae bacterium]|nr:nitrilase [Paracoccaceae bacterium]
MTLAIYQGPPSQGDPKAALLRLGTKLRAAAAGGADMLVVPELYLPGYNQPDLHGTLAQPMGGPWFQSLSQLAQAAKCGLTVGWAERDGQAVYNAATAFDAGGQMLGHYRKIQLFGPMEAASFRPGAAYCLFDLNGLKTALLICYDVEFAHHVRALAQRGAQVILVPTANPAGFEHVSRLLVPARAAEMGLTIAYANYCNAEDGLRFAGQSVIAGPDGQALAQAGTAEALLISSLRAPLAPQLIPTQLSDYRKV